MELNGLTIPLPVKKKKKKKKDMGLILDLSVSTHLPLSTQLLSSVAYLCPPLSNSSITMATATLNCLTHCAELGMNPYFLSNPSPCIQILNPLCRSGNSDCILLIEVLKWFNCFDLTL